MTDPTAPFTVVASLAPPAPPPAPSVSPIDLIFARPPRPAPARFPPPVALALDWVFANLPR